MSTTTGPSTTPRVLSAEDHLAILNLYARYNHTIDSGDPEGWAACWVADGVFNSTASNVVATGTAELVSFAEGYRERSQGRLRHHISNVFVEATDSGAHGGSYLLLINSATEEDPQTTIARAGIYDDELVKQDGQWLFSRRQVG
jgi:hypothetical protein